MEPIKAAKPKKSERRVVNVKWLSEDGDVCLKTKKKKRLLTVGNLLLV
jgi:hypothetical protein